jgi:dethiobiotin synthetase
MTKRICVTGIGTMVGKTLASAILCERLGADYWKPWGSGLDEEQSDPDVVRGLISRSAERVHEPLAYFKAALSPHVAARLEGQCIDIAGLKCPDTPRPLIVELAGGLMTPLSDTVTNLDVIKQLDCPVVVVSRHYLGSINHTLLTVTALRTRDAHILGLVFNGEELPDTESTITSMTGLPVLGRIPTLSSITPAVVSAVAETFSIEA